MIDDEILLTRDLIGLLDPQLFKTGILCYNERDNLYS